VGQKLWVPPEIRIWIKFREFEFKLELEFEFKFKFEFELNYHADWT
jgi:hypothetical protein